MNILVSSCLLGSNCRYDGSGRLLPQIIALQKAHNLIPFCPEIYGGLGIPRPASERANGRVVTKQGGDVTAQYEAGAQEALHIAKLLHCELAILKERSPACGHGMIHDGSFTGALTAGDGVTAELLLKNGIAVIGESEIEDYFKRLENA